MLTFLKNQRAKRRLQSLDIIIFLRQFATLINAGVPIIQACETLEASQATQAARILIYSIKRDLQAGNNLYTCMKTHDSYFDDITCQMINLGEQTGRLGKLLADVANYQEKRYELNRRIKQALLYPSMVLVMALFVSLSLLLFVIPRFAELFAAAHVQLPLMTRFFFSLSSLMQSKTVQIGAALALLSLLVIYKNLPNSRIRLPVLKPFLWKIFMAKFCRALSLTLAEGLPLHTALPFAASAAGGESFVQPIQSLKLKLSTGLSLHQSMIAIPGFPDMLVQMVKVGEESGKLPAMLTKAAEFFEGENEQFLHRISTLFEPLIIVVLGVVIGSLVISMYLPIFKLGSTI